MDAVTYPDNRVAQLVQEQVIPLRIDSKAQLAIDFNVHWTPTLVLLDAEGMEHNRTVGWLSPEDLMGSLLLGIGKMNLNLRRLSEAIARFGQVLDLYPKLELAPEALYMSGVARYKETHDLKAMRAVYDRLRERYPSSDWTIRASVYANV